MFQPEDSHLKLAVDFNFEVILMTLAVRKDIGAAAAPRQCRLFRAGPEQDSDGARRVPALRRPTVSTASLTHVSDKPVFQPEDSDSDFKLKHTDI